MKFTLEIELGNEAMQTPFDVGKALVNVGLLLNSHEAGSFKTFEELDAYDRKGSIRDVNGNTVGKWEVA